MINTAHIVAMIEHWLSTPPNSYLGSSYGAPLNELVLNRLSAPIGNAFIATMKFDLPVLNQLSANQLSLWSTTQAHEKRITYLRIGEVDIDLNAALTQRNTLLAAGSTFDVDAG